MKLSDVMNAIQTGQGIDAPRVFSAFRSETGSEDPVEFLSHLKRMDLVSEDAFRALHAKEPLELTEVLSILPGAERAGGRPTERSAIARAGLRYELLGTVGKGGMGLIWLARDLSLRRKVALKQLTPDPQAPEESIGRFVREVQITAQLDHPHIVPVYGLEAGPDGDVGYAMKLVQGITFGQFLSETRAIGATGRPLDEAHSLSTRLEHFLKVCDAVSFAHGKGVIHRDLKPPNLMLGTYNEVYVMDWGLARLIGPQTAREKPQVELLAQADARPDDTQLGTVLGTPRYMSPEQLLMASDELDGRSDQYSLGLILFELITLRQAVAGNTLNEVLANTAAGRLAPMRQPGAGPADALVAIVEKATALRREDRFESVAALAADIRRFLRDEETHSRRDTPIQRLQRTLSRHRRATLSALSFLIALSSLGFVLAIYRQKTALEASRQRERRIDELMVRVSGTSQGIENHFLELEGSLRGLAAAAVQALTHGTTSRDRFFVAEDFRNPERQPEDLAPSDRYRVSISAASPVWSIPESVPLTSTLPDIQRLLPLGRLRREIFLQSGDSNGDGVLSVGEASAENPRRPLLWSFIGLENGVVSFYPGTAIPTGYDPRQRPWYTMSARRHGLFWGSPHLDAVGTGLLVLSCSTSLYDDEERFLGVAGLDLTLSLMKRGLLAIPEAPSVIETFLLDEEGRILARSGLDRSRGKPGDAVSLEPFPHRAVIEELKKGITEHLELAGTNPPLLAVFQPLSPLRLSFVALIDRDRLLAP